MPQTLSPQALSQACRTQFASARLVATDMDGTLTVNGQFKPSLLTAFERLAKLELPVMIVTGRSAGWVSGLVHYLPVVGAIAENGGLYIDKRNPEPLILPDIPRMTQHRDRLETLFNKLKTRYPHLHPSSDNAYRITDWTFDIDGLTPADIALMQETCAHHTMGFTYSNVQCHLKIERQNKAQGLTRVLQKHFPELSPAQVLTVGDSPNDESLFDAAQFPCSVGVANVAHYLSDLAHRPKYITQAAEGEGFVELVDCLTAART